MKWMTFKEFSAAVRKFGEESGVLNLDDFDTKIEIAYRNYLVADTQERERSAQFDLLSRARIQEAPPVSTPCPECGKRMKLAVPPDNPEGYASCFMCRPCKVIFYSKWTIDQWIDVMTEELRRNGNGL